MYHTPEGIYVYVPRRSVVIFTRGRRPVAQLPVWVNHLLSPTCCYSTLLLLSQSQSKLSFYSTPPKFFFCSRKPPDFIPINLSIHIILLTRIIYTHILISPLVTPHSRKPGAYLTANVIYVIQLTN